MKGWLILLAALLLFAMPAYGAEAEAGTFDTDAQMDALGKDELMEGVPEQAKELMEEAGVYDLSITSLLHLSPREFFRTLWNAFVYQLKAPLRTLAVIAAVTILCAFLRGMGEAAWDSPLAQVFSMVAVLCVVLTVAKPILDCIVETARAIQDMSFFMVSFVPIFSAAMMAAGQPATGASYNMFLFTTCQVISQVVGQALVPLLAIYLGLCVVGAMVPEINIASATATIKNVVTWALGLLLTLFVALLSIQTMVSTGADSVTTKSAKFLISSFVPVVGGALSEAFLAAQGCLRLIKTSVGAYGIIVALFTFLPVFLKALVWYIVTNLSVIISDIAGVPAISTVLKSCSTVLGILIAITLCFGLLIIVSTTIVMATGLGTA